MKNKAKIIAPFLLVALLLLAGGLYWHKSFQDRFAAPRKDAPMVEFRVSKENTLMAVTGNLAYYGLVKDEEALKYALLHTKDNTPGNEESIKIGNNTTDTEKIYTISQSMSTWEIARILLNEGTPALPGCNGHGCPNTTPFEPELLPGGDIAPSLQEKLRAEYAWVKNYEDCIKAHGQLSSEQYSQRTGEPRQCINPDGRVFNQGEEGWTNQPRP